MPLQSGHTMPRASQHLAWQQHDCQKQGRADGAFSAKICSTHMACIAYFIANGWLQYLLGPVWNEAFLEVADKTVVMHQVNLLLNSQTAMSRSLRLPRL